MIKDYKEFTYEEDANGKIEYNLHTHNYLCGHASGEAKDYVSEACKHGMKFIGISDHLAQPRIDTQYVKFSELDDKYLSQINEAKKLFGGETEILVGGEIEYVRGNEDFYRLLLEKLDYLILGQHFFNCDGVYRSAFSEDNDENALLSYFDHVEEGIKTGSFTVLAHPDMILRSTAAFSPKSVRAFRKTIDCAKENDVFVELNANGIRSNGFFYPSDLLIDTCLEKGVTVVVSSDAHSPSALFDENFVKLYLYAESRGLKIATLEEVRKRIKG